jgi:DNA-binding MarR family transcriptional regulator
MLRLALIGRCLNPYSREMSIPQPEIPDLMRGSTVDNSLAYWISRVHMRLTHRVSQRTLVELGVTGSQAWILHLIASGRCRNPSDIAQECEIDLGAVTRLLDRVEKRGLLQRMRSTKDRRVVQLELTEQGTSVAKRVPHIFESAFQHAQAGLTQAEVGFLESLLRRVHLNCG